MRFFMWFKVTLDFILVWFESQCQPFICEKEVCPICHMRQVSFATAGSFWEIRGITHLVGMFSTHFSSSLSCPICHVCWSESKFGFITQPRQSYSLPVEKFLILWTVLLFSSLKPREWQLAPQEWLTVVSCNRTANECHQSWRACVGDLELGTTGLHKNQTKSFT